ncbi:MAG: flavin reductase family protein [Planctomycetes bacterium]|nr:flavin reductase family protein [Planctomycetota bacterium]
MPPPDPTPLARALGRIPSGLFVVTTRVGDRRGGFLASFVQQAAFTPPMLCLAIGRDRPVLVDVRATGRFAVAVVDGTSKGLLAAFTRRLTDGESPFDRLTVVETPGGLPVPADALAWIECRFVGELPAGDHVLITAEAVAGALLREGDPQVHLRRNGLSY